MLLLIVGVLLNTTCFAQNTDPYYQITKVKRKVSISEDRSFAPESHEQLDRVGQALKNLVSDTDGDGDGSGKGNRSGPPLVQKPGSGTKLPDIKPNPNNDYEEYPDYGYGYGSDNKALQVIEVFNKVWAIIEKNKPVVNLQSDKFGAALPEIAKSSWYAVGGWKPERNVTIKTTYENGFGMKVVELEYQVKLLYGGNVKGHGLYVASARIIPISVNVMWGYTLDVTVSVPNTFNVRTPENPLAAIGINVQYAIATIINKNIVTDTYQVQGNGLIQDTKSGKILLPAVLSFRD